MIREGEKKMKALVTGATSGIGQSIAKKLHKMGCELILTGRNKKMLMSMKKEFGEGTEIISADLSLKEDVYRVYKFCQGKNVDMLVNNAGFGVFGKFDETDLDIELELINLNITALHILTKLFLKDFKKQDRGIILNVASIAGFMTGPLLSSYYASKNYVLRLSMAIYEELRRDRSNVSITVLCPGPVDTNFNNRAGVSFGMKSITADRAADCALRSAFSRKLFAIPSFSVKTAIFGARFVPYKLLAAISYNVQRRKSDEDNKAVKR